MPSNQALLVAAQKKRIQQQETEWWDSLVETTAGKRNGRTIEEWNKAMPCNVFAVPFRGGHLRALWGVSVERYDLIDHAAGRFFEFMIDPFLDQFDKPTTTGALWSNVLYAGGWRRAEESEVKLWFADRKAAGEYIAAQERAARSRAAKVQQEAADRADENMQAILKALVANQGNATSIGEKNLEKLREEIELLERRAALIGAIKKVEKGEKVA